MTQYPGTGPKTIECESDGFRRIEEYGLIGNMETCALVSPDGSIDWCCVPYLESHSVFAAILDRKRGGHFSIRPRGRFISSLSYLPDTNVLRTVFSLEGSRVALTDFMPVKGRDSEGPAAIFRRVLCLGEDTEIDVRFEPRFRYGEENGRLNQEEGFTHIEGGGTSLWLQSPIPLEASRTGVSGRVSVRDGQIMWFVLRYDEPVHLDPDECERILKKTIGFWTDWSRNGVEERFDLEPHWKDLAVRSSLVLKLLTRPSTGAIAAAPTTSLPEIVGGIRNWDYRYAWIRDGAFTVQALSDMGHKRAVHDYFNWVRSLCHSCRDPSDISVCYRLDGGPVPEEQNLTHLEGYRCSAPVRIGNLAVHQFQLDIYGELVNAVYETLFHGERISRTTWRMISRMIDHVCENWARPDAGIWEMRKTPLHYTYSKVMCWVAVDRGLRIAGKFSLPAPSDKWKRTAASIRRAILEKGFDAKTNSFVQTFDSRDLDATSLLIPELGFLGPRDERILSTIEATANHLMKDGLVHRYRVNDGLPGDEPPFVLCSFWLVDALIISGQIRRAEEVFEGIVSRASPLGLFGEEIDPRTGEHRGNFPQAFSHIGLINSAFYLSRARRGEFGGPKSTQDTREKVRT